MTDEITTKRCSYCKQIKPLSEFAKHRYRKDGHGTVCKICQKKYCQRENFKITQKRYMQTPEGRTVHRKRTYKYLKRHPQIRRKIYLKSVYKMTIEEYTGLLLKQNGCCAICGKNQSEIGLFQIDHKHSTGKIRGLLCAKCNWLLGMANENIDILKNAILYIEKSLEK